METKVYNQDGQEVGKVTLPTAIFGVPWNPDLVHQVVTAMRANARAGTAHTKGRGEVRGGGKKPWRQKGTGRARHGSIRSPLWRGGGVAHGPRAEKDYRQKINKKMKHRALFSLLARKQRDGEIVVVDDLKLTTAKTKTAQAVINNLAKINLEAKRPNKLNYRTGCRALITVPQTDPAAVRSFRNLPAARLMEARNLNPLDLATYQYLVLVRPEESLTFLSKNHAR